MDNSKTEPLSPEEENKLYELIDNKDKKTEERKELLDLLLRDVSATWKIDINEMRKRCPF